MYLVYILKIKVIIYIDIFRPNSFIRWHKTSQTALLSVLNYFNLPKMCEDHMIAHIVNCYNYNGVAIDEVEVWCTIESEGVCNLTSFLSLYIVCILSETVVWIVIIACPN